MEENKREDWKKKERDWKEEKIKDRLRRRKKGKWKKEKVIKEIWKKAKNEEEEATGNRSGRKK